MATSPMQQHLRTYVEDSIQQKVRLNDLIEKSEGQHHKTSERILDEKALKNKFTTSGIDPAKTETITDRISKDEEILRIMGESLQNSKDNRKELTLSLNNHLEELSEIELMTGGFVTHAIGVSDFATLDKENMIIKFKTGGHAEVPIGVRLNKWKDSSQLTIKRI